MGTPVQSIREKHQPPGIDIKLPVFATEKPKYFMELMAITAFYASKIFPDISFFGDANAGLVGAKGFFGIPGAVKGAYEMVNDYISGKEKPLRDCVGKIGYMVSDALDGVKAFVWSGIAHLDKGTLKIVSDIKNVAALVGLSNDIYNDTVKLDNLSKVDPNEIESEVKDLEEAKQIKAQWITAEKDKVWWSAERKVTGVALCALGIAAGAFAISPWIFAVIVTASVTGKLLSHFAKQESTFWCNKFAEQVIPTREMPAVMPLLTPVPVEA